MTLARELGVGGTTLLYDSTPDHALLHRFRRGGLLARLRRPKHPPRLRSSRPIVTPPVLLTIESEWEDDDDHVFPVQEFQENYDHENGFPAL